MRLNKEGKYFSYTGKTMLILFLLFIIALFFSFIAGKAESEVIEIKSPSQCYTSLQPPSYLNKNFGSFFKVENNTLIFKNTRNISYKTIKNTGSMRPSISDNSIMITIKPINESEINIGDIISTDAHIMHRVVDKYSENGTIFFVTKGDNNRDNDIKLGIQPKITFQNITEKVIGVFY